MRKQNNKKFNSKSRNASNNKARNFTRTQDTMSEEKFTKDDKFKRNDISWYVTDDQILNDVARIPYSIPVGYPMARRGKLVEGLVATEFDQAIPGIASMELIPTIGNAEKANDAVNVAANGLYTFVRHLNSGSRNYDATDMIIYCMAVNCVYYVLSWCTRLYATLSLYAQGNRYLPDAILRAQRIDPNDLRSHMAEFRAGINQRIRKVTTLVVPAIMPIFARHSWLFSNYFIEGESIKDQIYLFFPGAWYRYEKDADEAGCLRCYQLHGNSILGSNNEYLSYEDLLQVLDLMIDPIFADEDFNIMSGDMLKAYGENNILKLGLIPDELPISLAYNEEVLLQFKNAKPQWVNGVASGLGDEIPVLQNKYMDDTFSIFQSADKSYVTVERTPGAFRRVYDFNYTNNWGHNVNPDALESLIGQAFWNEWSKPTMLTSPHANVEPKENMINTRLTVAFDIEYLDTDEDPYHAKVNHVYFGSEWPKEVKYWSATKNLITGEVSYFSRGIDRCKVLSMHDITSVENAVTSYLPVRSAFKYAPEVTVITNESQGDTVQVAESGRTFFEVDNYTLVDSNVIAMLHNAAIQGEYNIPRIAMFATR